jgi:hypothetical protein
MMFDHARRYLILSLIAGAVPLTACVGTEEELSLSQDESALDPAALDRGIDTAGELEAVEAVEMCERELTPSCSNERILFSDDGDLTAGAQEMAGDAAEAASCGVDIYFHPNNGAHGGWIESWRLCYEGGNQYKICTGGYAPVRFWNPLSCNGTVHDFYPQGWHGWAQTAGGCC